MCCKVFEGNGSLDNRDAHAFSPVERILGHFPWEAGPISECDNKETKIIILSLKFACGFDLEPKKLVT